MHLSLHERTKITVLRRIDGKQTPIQLPLNECAGVEWVYDTYGSEHRIDIAAPTDEQAWRMFCMNGEPYFVGETHHVLGRPTDSGRWRRVPLSGLDRPHYVKMPQKKVIQPKGAFDFMEMDKDGIYFQTDKPTELLALMESVAFCGVLVQRRKDQLRADIEVRRPVCFATKLITGNFKVAMEATLDDLTARGIISPAAPFDEHFIDVTRNSGVIFEGGLIVNDIPLGQPARLEKLIKVHHIYTNDLAVPVELSWHLS